MTGNQAAMCPALLLPLLESADIGVMVVDDAARVIYWNQWMQRADGRGADAVVGRPLVEVFSDLRSTRFTSALEDCLHFGMPATLSSAFNRNLFSFRAPESARGRFTRMQQSIRLRPIADDAGRHFCAIEITDVTAAVQRDLLLREKAKQMEALAEKARSSEARMRAVLENSADAILIVDFGGTVEPLNLAAAELLGPDGDPVLPDIVRYLLPDPIAANGHVPADRLIGDGHSGVIEILARRRDGHELPLELSLGTVSADNAFYICTLRDISQRKRHEKQLRETVAELERSNNALEQFAYAASHDLQEPLRMISSYTQLLARRYRGQLDTTADEFIAYAVDGARRMQNMIDDLLTYSRAGRRGHPFAPVSLSQVLDAVTTNLHRAEDGLAGEVHRGPMPTVVADPNQMLQLFQNLVGNGLKYHAEAPPRVEVTAEEQPAYWHVAVKDNGIGIAPEHHQTIFELFKRLHGHADYDGTGIGLALCKKIVERHDGRIWVDSAPGQGATFHVLLPKNLPIERSAQIR